MEPTQTFTMIKPDAFKSGVTGLILEDIIHAGFAIAALKLVQLSGKDAERFYFIHRERPFYSSLVRFMSSGPVVAAILKKENAVADFRRLIGATDPSKADEGTIRRKYAASIEENAIHGSDSDENALLEGSFFFSAFEQI